MMWSRGNFHCWLEWTGLDARNEAHVIEGRDGNVPFLLQSLWLGPVFWSCVYFHRPERRPRSRCNCNTVYWTGTRVPMSPMSQRLIKFARWFDGAPKPQVKIYWGGDRPVMDAWKTTGVVDKRNVIFTEAPRHQGRTLRYREDQSCHLPPPGWRCTRGAGHEGPCAAREITLPTRPGKQIGVFVYEEKP